MRTYKGVIRGVLSQRFVALAAVVACFAAAIWGFQFVKGGFFPASTSPQILVDVYLPEGTDIEVTRETMIALETEVASLEGVRHVHTLVGGAALRYILTYDVGSSEASAGQLLVLTEDYRQNGDLVNAVQSYIDNTFPDAQAKARLLQLGPGGGSKIEARFSGPDPTALRRLAEEAKAIMGRDGGAIMIKDDWGRPVPIYEPVYSQDKGERVGITRNDVTSALEEAFKGRQRGVFREGDNLIPIISRAPQSARDLSTSIATLPIITATNPDAVPLAQVLERGGMEWRDGKLLRLNRMPSIQAQCDPASGVLASDLFSRIRPQIEAIALPDGYALSWEGEFGDSSEAQSSLMGTIPLGLLTMVLVVFVLFNKVRQPIIIWSVVPLAIVGVVVGLVLTGTPLEFMGILGLLSLSGLLIQNSLVLVDATDDLIASGMPRFDALVESAASRLRPVTMGAFTTVLGVMPLYFDAFFESMTVVLVFGLSFATIITLLVTPVLYSLFFGIRPHETAQKDEAPA